MVDNQAKPSEKSLQTLKALREAVHDALETKKARPLCGCVESW